MCKLSYSYYAFDLAYKGHILKVYSYTVEMIEM
jgi:hypothetical protein